MPSSTRDRRTALLNWLPHILARGFHFQAGNNHVSVNAREKTKIVPFFNEPLESETPFLSLPVIRIINRKNPLIILSVFASFSQDETNRNKMSPPLYPRLPCYVLKNTGVFVGNDHNENFHGNILLGSCARTRSCSPAGQQAQCAFPMPTPVGNAV